jgi:uncharacterized membrane protein
MRPIAYSTEASVTIARSVPEVFAFYQDMENLPRFLGDVMHVQQLRPSLYRWVISGPFGIRLQWKVRVTEELKDQLIRYKTVGLLPTYWEVTFSPAHTHDQTILKERMATPFGTFGTCVLVLIGRPPAAEMSSNLNRLRQLLEGNPITDLSHSVPGKFARHRVA